MKEIEIDQRWHFFEVKKTRDGSSTELASPSVINLQETRGVAITFFADLKHPTICLKVLLFNRPFRRQLDQQSVEMIYFIAEFKSWGYLRFSNRNHDVERVVKIALLRIKKGRVDRKPAVDAPSFFLS